MTPLKTPLKTTTKVRDIGLFIRDQRRAAEISLRQLALQAGVSNPYLSQIERGLRKPSAEILQQIAKALRISAEALYVQAGFLDEYDGDSDVATVVLADERITERQKQVLLEIYESFRRENDARKAAEADATDDTDTDTDTDIDSDSDSDSDDTDPAGGEPVVTLASRSAPRPRPRRPGPGSASPTGASPTGAATG